MPADVFSAQQQFALVVHEHGRVHRPAVLAKWLERADALAQAVQPFGRWQGRAGQHLELGQCLLDRFHAAEPASAGTGQLPSLLLEVPERTIGDGHLRVLSRARAAELQVIDVRGVLDDAAAQAEADDEVFQVRGRDQHHRLADAIEGNG
ncbi:hypothetical protein D3C76_1030610 [compost metagenome]